MIKEENKLEFCPGQIQCEIFPCPRDCRYFDSCTDNRKLCENN